MEGDGRRCPRPIPELSTPASLGEAVLIVTYVAGDLCASGAVCVRARASLALGLPIQCHRYISTEPPPPSPPPPPGGPGDWLSAASAPPRPRPGPPLIEPEAHQSASPLPVLGRLPAPAGGCHCHCSSRLRTRTVASPPAPPGWPSPGEVNKVLYPTGARSRGGSATDQGGTVPAPPPADCAPCCRRRGDSCPAAKSPRSSISDEWTS